MSEVGGWESLMVSRLATPATCSDILRIAVGLFQSSVVTLADWGAQARMSEVDLDENELIGAVQDEETAFYKVPTHLPLTQFSIQQSLPEAQRNQTIESRP